MEKEDYMRNLLLVSNNEDDVSIISLMKSLHNWKYYEKNIEDMGYTILKHSLSDTEVFFKKQRNGLFKSTNVLPQDGLSAPPIQLKDDMLFQLSKDIHTTKRNSNQEVNVTCSIVLSEADLI